MKKINKNFITWNFNKKGCWFVDLFFSRNDIRDKVLKVRDYQVKKLDNIVLEILEIVSKERSIREENDNKWIAKKKYLIKNKNKPNIQISLDDEYALKSLIDKYKIYEMIQWLHFGKNPKIVKHCINSKLKIIENIYPICDQSIRKVIGSKVIPPTKDNFEDAVSNAWMYIIKYLPKIDTSKIMFSVFVGMGERTAKNFHYINLRTSCNEIQMSIFETKPEDPNNIDNDTFYNTIMMNRGNVYDTIEDIDDRLYNMEENSIEDIIYETDKNFIIDDYIDDLEDVINTSKETILQEKDGIFKKLDNYAFKIINENPNNNNNKFNVIYAKFFYDILHHSLSDKFLLKHSHILVKTINLDEITNENNNIILFRMLKDWCKENIKKIQTEKPFNSDNLINRMKNTIEFLKENINHLTINLIEFKNNVIYS